MRYCQACHRCYGDGVEFCLFDQTPTRAVAALPLLIDGKYRLEQLIAHGGMGAVYRATHLSLERPVAIKILRAELLEDAVVRERFHREARAAARLKHPNIVAVYDYGLLPGFVQGEGGAYLVMELIEGRSLREEMRTHAARHGQMRPERASFIMTQVCAGISAAHRSGIIHRDLKPDNVMIETGLDGAERVLVLDFGIAKLKDREATWQGLTDEQTIIGTPNYISPEQCTGQPVDGRADIYALGVILYEMLTGQVPFTGQNTSAVLLKHLQEAPAPPSRLRADLAPQLEQVVLRALAKNPQQRFETAAQFADALAAAARSLPPVAEPISSEAVTVRRGFVAPAAIDPVAPVVPLAEVETPSREMPAVRENMPSQSPLPIEAPTLTIEYRPRTKLYASVAVLLLAVLGGLGYVWYADWRAQAVPNAVATEDARLSGAGVQEQTQVGQAQPEDGAKRQAVLASYVKPDASPAMAPAVESAQRDLRAIYGEWATAAQRGDWQKHMSFYSDRVEYFRDGNLTRAKIAARKQAIFGKLDRYTLRFSDAPRIVWKQPGTEAELFFDRFWTLQRGRKRVTGKANGSVTMRRDGQSWRIVSEKQTKR